MRIREGQCYRLRNGTTVGPLFPAWEEGERFLVWEKDGYLYDDKSDYGHLVHGTDNIETDYDLVSEA
jgi:hypothetical protein